MTVLNDADTGNPQSAWLPDPLQPVTGELLPHLPRPVGTADSDCCTLANRYDFTPTTSTSWVDPEPGHGGRTATG